MAMKHCFILMKQCFIFEFLLSLQKKIIRNMGTIINGLWNFTAKTNDEPLTLSQLLGSLEQTIKREDSKGVWVKAEISKVNFYKYSGHAYPDLVERMDSRVVAQTRAIIWAQDFARINQKFVDILGQPLADGIQVLCYGRLSFSAQYGLSFIISDIDPQVTLGQFERERLECIKRLKKEFLFNLNTTKNLSLLLQRLAIISVSTSKGLLDFINVINAKKDKYGIFYHLFPSLLQGDNAALQMREVLQLIEGVKDYFDCVLIIRGGGGEIGLNCYNDYELCKAIARCSLPVLTGIGHSTNETVAEMVSYQNFITPTALGEFIVGRFEQAENNLNALKQRINQYSYLIIKEEYKNIAFTQDFIRINSRNLLEQAENNLNTLKQKISQYSYLIIKEEYKNISFAQDFIKINSRNLIDTEKINLKNIDKHLSLVNPLNILKKGYSITTSNGKVIKNTDEVKPGDKIVTQVFDGQFISTVN